MRKFSFEINWLNTLLVVNFVIFGLVSLISNSLLYESDYALIGALSTNFVIEGYFWLLITSTFLHFNLFHFLFNIFSLLNVGRIVLEFYSGKIVLITYILSGLLGSFLTVVAAVLTNTDMISIGASGSIFGLAGLLLGGSMKKQRYGYGLPFGPLDILLPISVAFFVGFIPGLGVNNWAHLGGFLTGMLLGFVLKTSTREISNKQYVLSENILYYSSLAILVFSFFLLLFNLFRVIFLF